MTTKAPTLSADYLDTLFARGARLRLEDDEMSAQLIHPGSGEKEDLPYAEVLRYLADRFEPLHSEHARDSSARLFFEPLQPTLQRGPVLSKAEYTAAELSELTGIPPKGLSQIWRWVDSRQDVRGRGNGQRYYKANLRLVEVLQERYGVKLSLDGRLAYQEQPRAIEPEIAQPDPTPQPEELSHEIAQMPEHATVAGDGQAGSLPIAAPDLKSAIVDQAAEILLEREPALALRRAAEMLLERAGL